MAKKKPEVDTPLDALLAAGDHGAARREAARLASTPGGEEAAARVAPRLGPERGAVVALLVGALLLLAISFLGLRTR